MNNNTPVRTLKLRTVYLIIGTIGLLFSGIIYAWSILKVPLVKEFGWTNDQMATSYTITISMFCIGCVVGGLVMKKVGPRVTIIAGTVLVTAGFYLTSVLNGSSVVHLYLSYGLMAGLGIGMAYNTILAVVGSWFPDKKGIATGILMMGFGASTLIFGNIASVLINSPSFGWRRVFLLLAVCTGAALLINGILMRLPSVEDEVPLPAAKSGAKVGAADVMTSDMLRRKSFWIFFAAMIFLGAAGSSVISFAKDFSLFVGTSAALAGLFVGILSIANGFGRILAGFIYDHFGRKAIMTFVSLIEIISCLICLAAAVLHMPVVCLVGFIAVGLSYGGNAIAISGFLTDFYGSRYYPQNLSFGMLTLMPSAFLAAISFLSWFLRRTVRLQEC